MAYNPMNKISKKELTPPFQQELTGTVDKVFNVHDANDDRHLRKGERDSWNDLIDKVTHLEDHGGETPTPPVMPGVVTGTGSSGSMVSVISGVISHGSTLPLPDGYTKEQCHWVVSMYNGQIADCAAVHAADTVCAVDPNTLVVTCIWNRWTDGSGMGLATEKYQTIPGNANYIVVGVKGSESSGGSGGPVLIGKTGPTSTHNTNGYENVLLYDGDGSYAYDYAYGVLYDYELPLPAGYTEGECSFYATTGTVENGYSSLSPAHDTLYTQSWMSDTFITRSITNLHPGGGANRVGFKIKEAPTYYYIVIGHKG